MRNLLEKLSLSDLCRDLQYKYGISNRKQALDERFNQYALTFIKKTMESAVQEFPLPCEGDPFFTEFNQIKVKDSTSFE